MVAPFLWFSFEAQHTAFPATTSLSSFFSGQQRSFPASFLANFSPVGKHPTSEVSDKETVVPTRGGQQRVVSNHVPREQSCTRASLHYVCTSPNH
uniref:Secreted protein n=1 Tax=Steinernema glaseri TaxID=37863 RepID=A0A1I8AEZ2_9BILA